MSVKTGLDFLREQREKIGSGSGDRIWNLWIKPGDRAEFWFLTDGPDLAVVLTHMVEVTGQKGRTFTKDVLCARSSIDDDTYCRYCEDQRSALRVIAYVYVTRIIHARRDPKVKSSDQWEPVRTASGTTVYKETVNAVRILAAKRDLAAQIDEAYTGDVLAEDYETRTPTLMDRPYQLKRANEEKSRETLEAAKEPREMPAEVRAALDELPPLEETVQSQFADRTNKPRQALRAAGGDGRAAPSDDGGFADDGGGGFDPDGAGGGGFRPGDDELEDLPF